MISCYHKIHICLIYAIFVFEGPSSGSSVDYTYKTLGIKYSFGVELRDGGNFGVLLPPEQIIPSAEEVVPAFLLVAERILKEKTK